MSTALTTDKTNAPPPETQAPGAYQSKSILEIASFLAEINDAPLIKRLEEYRPSGRRGYGPRSLWRAYMSGFLLPVRSISDLIRRLEDSPELRLLCGLHSIPHHSTFSRFIARLAGHADLVAAATATLTDRFAEELPGFGEKIAIDSSIIDAYATRFHKPSADPDASWTAKRGPNGEPEFHFGYKLHLAVDATYGVPIAGITSTGGVYDGHYLPPLIEQAAGAHAWFAPKVVTADKGYDSQAVHEAIAKYNATAVIPLRDLGGKEAPEGPYTKSGQLTCIGGQVMDIVKTDPDKGTLFRCPAGGCHLLKRKAVLYCQDEVWDKPTDLRRNPKIPHKTPEWKALYRERQTVERSFKSMKQARRLAEPMLMGLPKVGLHCAMSVLATSATMMARLRAGSVADMRWLVRKVA